MSVERIVKSVQLQSHIATMNLQPYLTYLMPDVGKIHYNRPAGLCALYKAAHFYGRNLR